MLKKEKMVKVVCFVTGFLGFSILGQYLLLNKLHFPMALMEIYYLPLLLLYKNKIIHYIQNLIYSCKKIMVILLFATFGCILLTLVLKGDILSIRSIIYLLLSINYFSQNSSIKIKNIYLLCLGAVLGEVFFRFIIDQGEMMSSMNCIALSGCIIAPYSMGKYILMFVSVFGTLLFSINTGYRIGIIVVISSVVVILFHAIFTQKRKNIATLKLIIVIVMIIISGIIFRKKYLDFINLFAELTNMSDFAKFRVTTRLQGLLEGDANVSQDQGRWNLYKLIITEFFSHIIPLGINRSNGDYIDVPILFLYDAWGSLLTVAMIFKIVRNIIENFLKSLKKRPSSLKIMMPLENILIIFLLITNGTFLKSPYQAIMTGIMVGTLLKINKENI